MSRKPVPNNLLDTYAVTDCRSLFDHLKRISAPTSIEEKRVAIDISAIREVLPPSRIRWCPTHVQLADYLTKIKPPREIMSLVQSGRIRLQDAPAPEEGQ